MMDAGGKSEGKAESNAYRREVDFHGIVTGDETLPTRYLEDDYFRLHPVGAGLSIKRLSFHSVCGVEVAAQVNNVNSMKLQHMTFLHAKNLLSHCKT